MPLHSLPTLNAVLNGTTALLLLTGYACIRRGRVVAHRRFMLAALFSSALFLISYLTYHFQVGSKHFAGTGGIRTVYLAILFSHTLLAAAIVPLVIMTAQRALRAEFSGHKRIARWTLPLWIYVSATGVIVYWMLYHFE
ncbi:MAG: DUF420 domain-containing protein [Acidobacteria bacterium]|nr:DUF420 domain-containing protein [Acidobacteriota bacterium]